MLKNPRKSAAIRETIPMAQARGISAMRNILIQSKIIMILDEIGLSIIAGQRQAERPVLTHRGSKRILADFFRINTHAASGASSAIS